MTDTDLHQPDPGPLRAAAEAAELAQVVSGLVCIDGCLADSDPLAPLARDIARSMTETGLTIHRCAQYHPLYRLGGVCLADDLGLGAYGDPPAQFGIWLQSYQPLTIMVDPQGLRTLPGSTPSNQFIGWAFAAEDGNSIADTARDLLTQLCEYTMHFDAFEQTLATFRE